MRIGADYYPEHWDRDRWPTDLKMMHEAGISVVRIGEFDWSLYEPSEGEFCFDWMDDILSFMQKNKMSVILCTPSATPPKWMTDKYGDAIYQADIHGNSKIFGTRKHYCFNSDVYREKNRVLVDAIAQRYADHPSVEAWQIDNEIGWADTTRCYCDKCEAKFRKYLKAKYKNIDKLNKSYGTVFWSQVYTSFDQVIIPRAGACYDVCHETQGQNPGLLLDFDRFSSDSSISFMKEQVEIIRKYCKKPITTNLLDADVNEGTGIDYFKMADELDLVTWDNYVEFQWGKADVATKSRDHALLRSYKHKPFWVMEQQSGPCGWSKMGPAPTPGKLRLWTYQAVANGADSVIYFRWRTAPFGTEQYWHGILGHDGKPNRRFAEISRIGAEMKKLSKTYGALQPVAKVAIVKSFDSEWSHSIHSHVEGFGYDKLLLGYYKAFSEMGVPVEFVRPEESLTKYSLVIAPALIMVDKAQKKNLETYVKGGGILLTTFRSGIKQMDDSFLMETIPGDFAKMAGVEVHDYDPLMEKETSVSGVFGNGKATLWCDIPELTTAQSLGKYTGDYYSGKDCLTVNRYGKGEVFYQCCDLDDESLKGLMKYLGERAGVAGEAFDIEGVESVRATDGKKELWFIMNHNDHSVTLPLPRKYKDALTDEEHTLAVTIEPYGVAALEKAGR